MSEKNAKHFFSSLPVNNWPRFYRRPNSLLTFLNWFFSIYTRTCIPTQWKSSNFKLQVFESAYISIWFLKLGIEKNFAWITKPSSIFQWHRIFEFCMYKTKKNLTLFARPLFLNLSISSGSRRSHSSQHIHIVQHYIGNQQHDKYTELHTLYGDNMYVYVVRHKHLLAYKQPSTPPLPLCI